MTINTQEETIIELQEKVLSLKKKQRSVNQSRSQQSMKFQASIKNHTQRKSFTLFDNDHHKFFKFSNSFIFTDEDESTWDSWRIKIDDKLQTNVDHFNNENICIVYVISRLKDNAAEHIFTWCWHDALHSYILINELFEHLKEIYDELNKNQKCHCKYNALKQADKFFNVFYFNFMKLFNYLKYDDCTLMNDLQNKINNQLQNTLSVCSENFTSLTCLKIFLQDVNNKQRVNYQLRSQLRTVIIKVTVVPDKCVATSLSVTTSIINYVKFIISSISESAKSSIICYTCKIFDHLFKNIFEQMNKTLIFAREALIKTQEQMMNQANKHRKKINYEIESKMFLNERNIITARLFKKLNNKMLDSFQIINLVELFYKLKLSDTMHIHDVFHSELLCLIINNFLSDQKNKLSKSIVVNDEDEWKINDILNFQWYQRWLQYWVKWKSYDNDLNWYNADNDEFMNAQEMIDDFHIKYSRKAH